MKKDLSIMVDDTKLNIRVGVILKYQEKVLLELSKVGSNSVIPGGRVRINEKTREALVREVKEEMAYNLDIEKLKFLEVIENFFIYEGMKVHELFFVYQYPVNEKEYQSLINIKDNQDSQNTYFAFITMDELDKVDLLPVKIIDIIKTLDN